MSKNEIKVSDKKLSIDQRGSLINRVVNSCFNGSDLHIEMLEPIFAITVMQMLTDREPITTKTTIDDREVDIIDYNATYEMIEDEDIIGQIQNAMYHKYQGYLEDLHSDVVESLEYKKAQNIAQTSSVSDSIILSVTNVIDSVRKMLETFDPSQYKDVIELAKNANKFNVTKNDFINGIVKNLPKKEENKVETKSDKVDNVTPIPSPTEG